MTVHEENQLLSSAGRHIIFMLQFSELRANALQENMW